MNVRQRRGVGGEDGDTHAHTHTHTDMATIPEEGEEEEGEEEEGEIIAFHPEVCLSRESVIAAVGGEGEEEDAREMALHQAL